MLYYAILPFNMFIRDVNNEQADTTQLTVTQILGFVSEYMLPINDKCSKT